MKHIVIIISLLLCAQAHAAVYKCGNTYSDTPCSPDAERKSVSHSRVSEEDRQRAIERNAADQKRIAEQDAAEEQRRREQRRASYEDLDRRSAAANGLVKVGMTKAQVITAWGKPDRYNKRIDADGTMEQFVYINDRFNSQYVHFRNGIVISAE